MSHSIESTVNVTTNQFVTEEKNIDLKNSFMAAFKKEAARIQWTDFDSTLEDIAHIQSEAKKLTISELLLEAGLFKLLGSSISALAPQWIFYNGLLLSSPSDNYAPLPYSSPFTYSYQNEHFSLSIPNNNNLESDKANPEANPSPLYLIYINHSSNKGYASKPKISIMVEENAQASIIECYVHMGAHLSFIQSNTEIILGTAAKVEHSILTKTPGAQSLETFSNNPVATATIATSTQARNNAYESVQSTQEVQSVQSTHIAQVTIEQNNKSEYRGFLTTWNLNLYKTKVLLNLKGTEGLSEFNVLQRLKEAEYSNIEITEHHQLPNSKSQILARSVLQDTSRLDFIGKIMVDENAEGTNARLENKNLLLSSKAEAHTEPQLEIYNGNIQCSHGATVGYLDESALFYLQSRGIEKAEAQQMLVQAFLQPVIQNIPHKPLQTLLEDAQHAY